MTREITLYFTASDFATIERASCSWRILPIRERPGVNSR